MADIFKRLAKFNNSHIINLLGNGGMSLVNMAISALLFRYMSIKDVGIWVFFQSTLGLVDTLRAGLLTTAFIKYYAGASSERAREVLGSTWLIAILITALFLVANFIISLTKIGVYNESLLVFIKWFGVVFIITLPSFIASCVLQAEQKFDKLTIIRFISQGLSITLLLVLIFLHKVTLNNVLYTGFIAGAVTSIVAMLAGWAKINTIRHKSTVCIQQLLHFGKYSIGNAFGSSLFRNSDTIIINFVLGPGPLAAYNLGLRLLELVEMPLRSLSATILPLLSASFNMGSRGQVIYVMKKYASMLSLLLIPISLLSIAFADQLIYLVNKQYLATDAATAFRILMFFSIISPIDRFMGITLDAVGLPKANFIKLWAMLATNIVADIIFIYIFKSINGIAIASLFPMLGSTILGYVYLNRYESFSLVDLYTHGLSELRTLSTTYLSVKKT